MEEDSHSVGFFYAERELDLWASGRQGPSEVYLEWATHLTPGTGSGRPSLQWVVSSKGVAFFVVEVTEVPVYRNIIGQSESSDEMSCGQPG